LRPYIRIGQLFSSLGKIFVQKSLFKAKPDFRLKPIFDTAQAASKNTNFSKEVGYKLF